MAIVDLRYARALSAVVNEQKLDRAAVQAQLSEFSATLQQFPELREVMENPSIPEQQKLRVLDGLVPKLNLSGPVRNFIAVVTRHGRLPEFSDLLAAYHAEADQDSHIAEAEITTARPLAEGDRQMLERHVADLVFGQRVRATYREDPSLLGGAIVRLGSTVYDGSVRAQLEQMKQRLIAATV